MAEKLIRMGVGLFIGVWVARYLAPAQFGILSELLAVFGLATLVSNLGMDSILIRFLVKYPNREGILSGTAFFLRLGASVLVLGLFIGTPLLLEIPLPIPFRTWFVLCLLILGQSFGLVRHWFDARVLSKYVVLAELAAFFCSTLLKIVGILGQHGVGWFACISIGELTVAMGGYLYVYLRKRHPYPWRFDPKTARLILRQSLPMLLANGAILVYMKIDQVMIPHLASNVEAGLYAAAARLSETPYFIPSLLATSTLPALTTLRKANREQYLQRLGTFLRLMTGFAYTVALMMTFLSPFIVKILYGPTYQKAGLILAVHCWAIVWVCHGLCCQTFILNEKLTHLAFVKDGLCALINIGLNLILIPKWGGLGAALATTVSYSFSAFFANALFPPLRPFFKLQLRALLLRRSS